MNLWRHGSTLVIAVVLAAFSPKLFAQTRLAVVDMQRALNETEDGRRAKAQLQKVFKQRQTSLDKQQEDLKKMKETIEKQGSIWTPETKRQKVEEYQKAFVELQTTYVEYQRELATKEAQLTKGILERMQGILRRIGQAESYSLIVERNEGGVVWVPGHLDITDQLIQRYNSGEGATPAAGGRPAATKAGGGAAATKAKKAP